MQQEKGVPPRKISNYGRKRPIISSCLAPTMWAVPYSKTPFQFKFPKRQGFSSSPRERTDWPINLPIPILLVTWQEVGKNKTQMQSDCIPRKVLCQPCFSPSFSTLFSVF